MVRSCQRSVPHPDMISSRTKPARFTTHRQFAARLPQALALAVAASPPVYGADAATRADLRFTNYAFAHEFGSGVYDFNGRTLQVYGLPFGWTAVEPGKDQAGLRLRLPVTLGFLDFHAADVIESALAQQPGADDEELRTGLEHLRSLASHSGAGLGWVLHKSTAIR